MRKRATRSGFTLVELLVVIAIITMLAGMLLPAVQQAREAGRRATCTNNQRQVGIAFQNHDGTKGYLPGARHSQSLSTTGGARHWRSFVWPLLPFLDRNDIYQTYGVVMAPGVPGIHLKALVCPNDSTSLNNGSNITYVVNTGRYNNPDVLPSHTSHAERFSAQFQHGAIAARSWKTDPKVSLSFISSGDGTANTIMLSENIDAASWLNADERQVSILWDLESYQAGAAKEPGYAINGEVGMRTSLPAAGMATAGKHTRPSSYHGGGVLATFCDSHVQWIDESINYVTYCQLMTSRGSACVDDSGAPLSPAMPVLSENSF